ncbi:hypothetical protein Cni_G13099 [Canna indica]|uniref:SWIM-type domain-containing protein n=1 Tax=Canna indica TaxID=4628 RepID=A0AAQ3QCT4_9LILI|nr:hypothetical protein Cni_G13099 [Canna indica]
MLDKHVLKSAKWRASWVGGTKYEVRNFDGEKFTIGIDIKYCSCRLWALYGLPYEHVVCVIYAHSGDPHEFVDSCYSSTINPINGENMWVSQPNVPIILPSVYRVPIRRPKKARRREKDELENKTKWRRCNTSHTCQNYDTYGHNK